MTEEQDRRIKAAVFNVINTAHTHKLPMEEVVQMFEKVAKKLADKPDNFKKIKKYL